MDSDCQTAEWTTAADMIAAIQYAREHGWPDKPMMTRWEVLEALAGWDGELGRWPDNGYAKVAAMCAILKLGTWELHSHLEQACVAAKAELALAEKRERGGRGGLPTAIRAEAERRGPLPEDWKGSWPGDETDEEIEQALAALDGKPDRHACNCSKCVAASGLCWDIRVPKATGVPGVAFGGQFASPGERCPVCGGIMPPLPEEEG